MVVQNIESMVDDEVEEGGATVFVYSDSYFFAIGKEKEVGV